MDPEAILKDMKQKNLIDFSAYILQRDVYIYEQFPYNMGWYNQLPKSMQGHFEILDTAAFGNISRYLSRWEAAMVPYHSLFPGE
ncbi:MAG: hypothetical protein HY069_01660 [Chlamydiia bacterium]|nr:hypothetical protein [Chlamydiia bacterium]